MVGPHFEIEESPFNMIRVSCATSEGIMSMVEVEDSVIVYSVPTLSLPTLIVPLLMTLTVVPIPPKKIFSNEPVALIGKVVLSPHLIQRRIAS